jgi:hypothetical protein
MSRTHVFLRCMHPELESARKDIWERPDEDGRRGRRPRTVGQLLGNALWANPLPDWIVATGVGLHGPGKRIMRRNDSELRGMTDGDMSHSSERRLDTCTKGISRDLCSL